MTTSLWIVLAAALIAAFGTIYTARMTLKNSQDTLKQSFDLKMREIAEDNRQEADKTRQTERGSNLAEALQIREELKEARDEMRLERDRMATDLKAERTRATEAEKFSQIERNEFRAEISMLQSSQREIDTERAQNKLIIDGLKKQHADEIAKYKKELSGLIAKIARMEARIKELETGKAGDTNRSG